MTANQQGVDLLLRTGSLADPPADYVVIEINAAPGLDNYAASGAVFIAQHLFQV